MAAVRIYQVMLALVMKSGKYMRSYKQTLIVHHGCRRQLHILWREMRRGTEWGGRRSRGVNSVYLSMQLANNEVNLLWNL